MNRKAIKSAISRKFDGLLETVTDPVVRELMRKNTVISGGCIVSMLLREKVKDYDLYFTNKETVEAVCNYYVDQFNKRADNDEYARKAKVVVEGDRVKVWVQSIGVDGEDYDYTQTTEEREEEQAAADLGEMEIEEEVAPSKKHRPIFLSTNAISLAGNIQLVIRFYGTPAQIHDNYDFVHCTSYWTSCDEELVMPSQALEAILAKQLIYVGSLYPICSIIRTRKFIRRGWTCNAGQYLKMAWQVSQLDMTKLSTMEDQLVGVDSAYFNRLIDLLRERVKDHETIDQQYLYQVINSIF